MAKPPINAPSNKTENGPLSFHKKPLEWESALFKINYAFVESFTVNEKISKRLLTSFYVVFPDAQI